MCDQTDRGRKGDQVDVVRKCMMRQDFDVMGMGKLYWKFLGKVDKNTNFNVSDHKKSIVKPFYYLTVSKKKSIMVTLIIQL